MTPDERDRLRTVEVELKSLKEWLQSIDGKVDEIREAAHMGKGAWVLLLKVGAVIGAVLAAAAWIYDRLPWRHP